MLKWYAKCSRILFRFIIGLGLFGLVFITSGCQGECRTKGYTIIDSDKGVTQTVHYGFTDNEIHHVLIINNGNDNVFVNIRPSRFLRGSRVELKYNNETHRIDRSNRVYLYDQDRLHFFDLKSGLNVENVMELTDRSGVLSEEDIVKFLVD